MRIVNAVDADDVTESAVIRGGNTCDRVLEDGVAPPVGRPLAASRR